MHGQHELQGHLLHGQHEHWVKLLHGTLVQGRVKVASQFGGLFVTYFLPANREIGLHTCRLPKPVGNSNIAL